jgi:release factor glutamine methyltransferase
MAVDISADALAVARRNASLNGVADRITFVERDMFWFFEETKEKFRVIISNPPYIPTCQMEALPEDVKREPSLALDGGPDGLHFYRFLIPAVRRVLEPGGLVAFEFGDGQRKDLEKLFAQTGEWDKIKFIKDNTEKDRAVLARTR